MLVGSGVVRVVRTNVFRAQLPMAPVREQTVNQMHEAADGAIEGRGALAHPSPPRQTACEPLVREVALRMRVLLQRPLRILALGCDQGDYVLGLAADGHSVRGIAGSAGNVAICRARAIECGLTSVQFDDALLHEVVDELQIDDYDMVLALEACHRPVREGDGMAAVLDRIAGHVAVVLCASAGRAPSSVAAEHCASAQLQAYAFVRRIARAVTPNAELLFASNRLWYLGDDMRPFDAWRSHSHFNDLSSHQGSRRYFFADGVVLKQLSLTNPERREINRREYSNEVAFLRAPAAGVKAPALLDCADDGDALWILRELLPGQLLSEAMASRTPYAHETVIDSLIAQLAALERAGLLHGDVRCWNILLDAAGESALIDYGAISSSAEDCQWPHEPILALLLTVREILLGHVRFDAPVRPPMLDVGVLPARYRSAFLAVFALPRAQWSIASLQHFLVGAVSAEAPAWTLIPARLEVALRVYQQKIDGLREQALALEQQVQQARANSRQWQAAIQEKDVALAELRDRLEAAASVRMTLRRRQSQLIDMLSAATARHDAMREERDVALRNGHHWFVLSGNADAQLRVIYGSWSWKLTRPVRLAGRLLRAPRATIRRILVGAMRRVLQRPVLARPLNALLLRFPLVHARLKNIALGSALVADESPMSSRYEIGQVESFSGVAERQGISRLSARGRDFYVAISRSANQDKE